MIETIGNLVRYIVILLFLTVLLEMILPQGIFRSYLRVLVGILLIFTILSPLQKIMHITPLLNEDNVFAGTEMEREDLEQILAGGEALQKENESLALQDYRSNIFTLLENELNEKFGKDLLQLEVSLEEDSSSEEFGSLQELSLIIQDREEKQMEKKGAIKVEKIHIKVHNTAETAETAEASKKEKVTSSGPSITEEDVDVKVQEERIIERHLASFFQISPEKVKVKILP